MTAIDRPVGLLVRLGAGRTGGIETMVADVVRWTSREIGWRSLRVPVEGRGALGSMKLAVRAFQEGRRLRPEFIMVDRLHVGPFGVMARAGAGWRRCGMVSWVYGSEVTHPRRRWPKRFALLLATDIVAISGWTRERLADWSRHAARARIIRPGVDSRFWAPEPALSRKELRHRLELPAEEFLVLSVSRLERNARHKGIDRLAEAIALLRGDGKKVAFVLAGSGADEPWVESCIARCGIEDHTYRFRGASRELLRDLYRASDLFALPSVPEQLPDGTTAVEGFGIVFLEAASAGCPSLTTGEGGTRDAVCEGVSGHFCDGSPAGIAHAIDLAYTDRRLLSESDIIAWARQNDWASRIPSLLGLFQSARDRNTQPRMAWLRRGSEAT